MANPLQHRQATQLAGHWFPPEDLGTRPMFHMLAEGPTPVPMGHVEGVVTIVLPDAARRKLAFVHEWLRRGARGF